MVIALIAFFSPNKCLAISDNLNPSVGPEGSLKGQNNLAGNLVVFCRKEPGGVSNRWQKQ